MNNSEILFIYDAKLTNPNGDPDDENRPRMDYEKSKNLVSDVRLKRYIRDYFEDKGKEIFVSKVEGKTVNATDRLKKLLNGKAPEQKDLDTILDKLIDVRLFGATMPIKGSGSKGSSIAITGPVQFNWGYSLNNVTLVDSTSITSHFSGDSKNQQGTIGKDYRVYYSLLSFHGIISGQRARETRLKEEDVELMDEAMIKAIPLAATRSKIGQYPRLYLRVEYVDNESFIGDFRDFVEIENKDGLREINDTRIDISKLVKRLKKEKGKIRKINYWQSADLPLKANDVEGSFEELMKELKDKISPVNV